MSKIHSVPKLLQEANHCVACGLCLPHCPTYRKTLSEADSPRGRIALIRGVLEQRIPLNHRFAEHIDQCLICRACEHACPSGVKYGQLMDGARAVMTERNPEEKSRLRSFLLDQVLAEPSHLRLAARGLRLAQQSGVMRLAGKLGRFGELLRQVPVLPPLAAWRDVYPALGQQRGEVQLFIGCVARVADTQTLSATIFLLTRLGYAVSVPKRQTCCGALYQHGGEPARAAQMAQQNLQAFATQSDCAVMSTASGCGAMLAEYGEVLGDAGQRFAGRVVDVVQFLDQLPGWDGLEVQPLAETVAVHDPCSLRNVLCAEGAPYRLLTRIPQAEIVPLAGNDQCCGAAGLYAIDQPEMAGRLMSDKIGAIRVSAARILVTSNIGCALGLINGLRTAGLEVEVLHPVTLLARQMGFNGHA